MQSNSNLQHSHFDFIILGAGISGLTSAHYLQQDNYNTLLIEKDNNLGGLASSFALRNNSFIEKYYHHFFSYDTYLIDLLKDLKLENLILWQKEKISIYKNGQYFPFFKPLHVILYKPLSFANRLKLLFLALRMRYIKLEKYNNISVKKWFEQNNSSSLYRDFWGYFLKAKFKTHADAIPLSFLCGRLQPRAKSKQKLAYIKGSFRTLFCELKKNYIKNGGIIKLNERVNKVEKLKDGTWLVQTETKRYYSKKLVSSLSINELNRVLNKKVSVPVNYMKIKSVVYVLNRSFGKYYWNNILDEGISFQILVEHTRLIPNYLYGDKHIIYVAAYEDICSKLPSNKDELVQVFNVGLKKLNPSFSTDWVEDTHYFKNDKACPVYDKAFFMNKREIYDSSLYLVDMSKTFPFDRNINHSIRIVKEQLNYIKSKVDKEPGKEVNVF